MDLRIKNNKNLSPKEEVERRRGMLEKKLFVKLPNIGFYSLNPEQVKNRNCENMIGAVQVPIGIAGPLKIRDLGVRGKNSEREYYLPLATTEGALVASVNRGCKAVTNSGGVNVFGENIGITRGSVFKTKNLKESFEFKSWLEENFLNLKNEAEKTSEYLFLINLKAQVLGKSVYVRFYYDTSEAMGMNMATLATEKISDYIKKKKGIKCLSLSANFCVDKKPSWLNFILGRGQKVWAEATIKRKIIKEVLKTTPEKIVAVIKDKCWLGSMASGSLGFNSHFANIIAAIFLATGQDLAHVTEGSLGITTGEVIANGDLYFSIYLPDLIVGVVGGGTGLATQKEALSILGISPGEKSKGKEEFAKVIAGAVLAGELSLLAALASGDLVKAHERLGRGKK